MIKYYYYLRQYIVGKLWVHGFIKYNLDSKAMKYLSSKRK